jgi:signal transduction histidine kinase
MSSIGWWGKPVPGTSEEGKSVVPVVAPWYSGVRARLLLAFFGISGFVVLAAAVGIFAFREVGDQLELIGTRVPLVSSSMEVSRAADRLIASAPALLAATTAEERDDVSRRMRPEVDRLNIGLNSVIRVGMADDASTAVASLAASLQSSLVELEDLVGQRLKSRDRLSGLLRSVFQANQETQGLFAPWFQVLEMQIDHSLEKMHRENSEQNLAASIRLDRSAQAAQRGFATVVGQLVQTATTGQKQQLSVVEFQLRRSLDDLESRAKSLDPKLQSIFSGLVARLRELAIGPEAILAVRDQELSLIGQAEQLIEKNIDLSARLTKAVDHLVSEAETDVGSSAGSALSVQRVSARILLGSAIMSLISSILIVWLYVGRNLTRRLVRLNKGMLAIVGGTRDAPIDVAGTDEVAEMGRVVEIFRKNTLERDQLLAEKAKTAEFLEHQVKKRTAELAQSVEELRALGDVSQAVNSTIDIETVLSTIVAKATQLSNTEAGAIYVFDEKNREFRLRATYGMDDTIIAEIKDRHIRSGETAVGHAVDQRMPIQIPDVQDNPRSSVLDVIVRAGFRALLVVPLLGADRTVGALVVRRKQPGEFPKHTVDLLQTFAAQSVIALQNARLYENVEARTRELAKSLDDLRTTQDRLVQTEKLASLGQLTAGIAHEMKNPLNFVNNFSGISAELVVELEESLSDVSLNDKRRGEVTELMAMLRGNLNKIVQHGMRADAIVKNMLQHSREGSGEHRIVDINALVEESLNLAWHGARAEKQGFDVTLERSFDPSAGEADIFPQDITRALLNLIINGFYAAIKRKADTNGGDYVPMLAASTKSLGDRVEIRIRDNGTGIPPEVKDKMFNPFFTTKPTGEGTGLGLSISHDIIVKQHGGLMEVDTQPGEFTEIRVVLPRIAALLPERS